MIKDTIEKAKDTIQESSLSAEEKMKVQNLLSEVRSELFISDYLNTQILARLDVYADICNKILDRLSSNKYD